MVRLSRKRKLGVTENSARTELDLVPVIDFLIRPIVPAIVGIALVVMGGWVLAAAPSGSSKSGLLGASLVTTAVVALAITWLGWSRDEATEVRRQEESALREKRDRHFVLALRHDFHGWTMPPGTDLSDIYLPQRDFSQADLHRVILNGAILTGCTFTGANLMDSEFRSAELYRAVFKGATLGGTHFDKAKLIRANFDDAGLNYAHLDSAQIQHASFKGAALTGTVFTGVDITGVDFSESEGIEEADLSGARVIIRTGETIDAVVKFPASFNWQDRGLQILDLNLLKPTTEATKPTERH